MLVEDTTAFIEQLEVRRDDKRAGKRRRLRLQAEVALLRAEWEARVAAEALVKMEQELATLPAPVAGGPGRRLLVASRRRWLEHEIETVRARARAKRAEVEETRRRLRRLDDDAGDVPSRAARLFRLHSADHHLECSERQFARFARSQADLPVLVAKKKGRRWWWYLDRFWWDEDGLGPREVEIVVLDGDLRRSRELESISQARATLLGEERPRAGESLSRVVRFAVWCRDRGRCVDCGTDDKVGFDAILSRSRGGALSAANVELRCGGCRERRAHNQERTRVSRARADAASPLH